MNARRYQNYDSIASCLCSYAQHQVRIDPTAEHPTSRRLQNLNKYSDASREGVNTSTHTRPELVTFQREIKASNGLPDFGLGADITKFDKIVVSIARTVPVKTDSDHQYYDVGIDVAETQPGTFQISSIHDDCSGNCCCF